jgi:Phosphotyrosyl phosphate activator (PTPA) protein
MYLGYLGIANALALLVCKRRRLTEEAPAMLRQFVPQELVAAGALDELLPYLCTAFGHEQRIDYGTGHETNFAVWLCCLWKLGVFTAEDLTAVVRHCYLNKYIYTCASARLLCVELCIACVL